MDVHSGYPYWLVKNGLLADYPALEQDLENEDVVIVGSGISGALVAHALCGAGFRCIMLDKRIASSGSTWASTAQVNYELDSFMHELAGWYGEPFAAAVYGASLNAVDRIKEIAAELGQPELVQPTPSLYLASDKRGAKALAKEAEMRQRHNLPVSLLDEKTIEAEYGFNRRAALYHTRAVQLDAYKFTATLLQHNAKRGLTVYTRTEVKKMQSEKDGVLLHTASGQMIKAKAVVCAPGYEAGKFLPKNTMDLNSTYALVTQPLPERDLWKGKCLIWETARPYFYMRTTADNRIMMGGEDESFHDPGRRDKLLEKKKEALLEKVAELFPHLKLEADFYWCGTFAETGDGLPNIGLYPGLEHVYFALGYGGNGTSYSTIAAEIICNQLQGRPDPRAELFRFGRKHA